MEATVCDEGKRLDLLADDELTLVELVDQVVGLGRPRQELLGFHLFVAVSAAFGQRCLVTLHSLFFDEGLVGEVSEDFLPLRSHHAAFELRQEGHELDFTG